MLVGAIFLTLALILAVALFIARPLLNPADVAEADNPAFTDSQEHHRSALLAERDRLITALRELDFDHSMGKIPAEDYQPQRSALAQGAAAVLRQLDELGEAGEQAAPEERVEQAVRPASTEEDELEELIASRRRKRQGKAAGFCSSCGRPLQKADRFCPYCGAVVR